jgi:hypothetical protein
LKVALSGAQPQLLAGPRSHPSVHVYGTYYTKAELLNLMTDAYSLLPIAIRCPMNKHVTLINVFTVEPANQQRLVELLTRATEDSV